MLLLEQAREILLLAFGENKTSSVAKAVEGPVTPAVPASFLQAHPNATFYLDGAASAGVNCLPDDISKHTDWCGNVSLSLTAHDTERDMLYLNIHSHTPDAGLSRVKTPWLVGDVTWSIRLQKQAVIWLARRLKRSILKLTAEDYAEHSLQVNAGFMPSSALAADH